MLTTELVYYFITLSFVLPVLVGVLFTVLHALIQAYVLTMLTSVYYGEVTEKHEKKPKKKKGWLIALLIILLLLIAAAAGAYWWFFLRTVEVDPTEYISVSVDGVNGYASAKAELNLTDLREASKREIAEDTLSLSIVGNEDLDS